MRRYWLSLAPVFLAACSTGGRDGSLTTYYRYDRQQRLVESGAPGQTPTRYYYDADGRLSSVSFQKGRVAYGYRDGELLWMSDRGGTTEFFRDGLGRVADLLWTRESVKLVHLDLNPRGQVSGVFVYRLDGLSPNLAEPVSVLRRSLPGNAAGWRKRRAAFDQVLAAVGSAGKTYVDYSVRYQRDILGRVTGMDTAAGRVTFRYRDNPGEVERTLPNGVRTLWRSNGEGQLEYVAHWDATGRELASWSYTRDAGGYLSRITSRVDGKPVERTLVRDERGVLREVRIPGKAPEAWSYDAYGRPVRQGAATLQWTPAGTLAERSVNGARVQFEYDGRGLPLRAQAGRNEIRYRWDGQGRLDRYSTASSQRFLLPDVTGSTSDPWIEWGDKNSSPVSFFSDGSVFAEVGSSGAVRYLLRDGEGKVCLTAGADGQVRAAGARASGRSLIRLASFETGNVEGPPEEDDARELAATAQQFTGDQNWLNNSPEIRGWFYATKVNNFVDDFLKSSKDTDVNYVFKGIDNNWETAWKETQDWYPKDHAFFIPTFAAMPKQVQLGSAIVERLDPLQTKKLDLIGIIERTEAAGKHLHSLVFESGAGLELQKQVRDLVRYANENPGVQLPEIVINSTSAGADNVSQLRAAHYRCRDQSPDQFVATVVDPGIFSRIPLAGPLAGVVIQAPLAIVVAANDFVHGRSPLHDHGFDPNAQAIFPNQAGIAAWAGAPPHDPSASLKDHIGGVELGAKAAADSGIATIRGVAYDEASHQVALLGDSRIAAPGLDAEDFALALLMAYHDPPITPRFSLDPADPHNPDGPWQKAVYLPAQMLAGTRFGQTMFITDWLMKQYAFGVSVDSDGNVNPLPTLPGGLVDQFTLSFRSPMQGNKQEVRTRLWIVAEDFKVQVDHGALIFETARMGVRARRQVVDRNSPTGLRDDERDVDAPTHEFATRFGANYDRIAAESPEFHRLRELAKAMALANWLRETGVPVDLEWARRTAGLRTSFVDKVPSLSRTEKRSEGGYRTTLRLSGGVDLMVKTAAAAASPLAAEAESAVPQLMRAQPSFQFKAGEDQWLGDVLPVTPAGRAARERAHVFTSGGAIQKLDAAGKPVRLEYPSGKTVDYVYGKGGTLSQALVRTPGRPLETYQFAPGLKIQSGTIADGGVDGGKVAVRRDANGAVASIRFSGRDNGQAEVFFGKLAGPGTPDGGTRWTVTRGGRTIHYHYDARGNLVSVNADGRHVASFAYDDGAVTLIAGDYRERMVVGADGAVRRLEVTAQDLDGQPFTQSTDIPATAASRLQTPPDTIRPSSNDRVFSPTGGTVAVDARHEGGSTTVAITQRPAGPDVLLGPGGATVDATGRVTGIPGVDMRLGSASAPQQAIVVGSPEYVTELNAKFGGPTDFYLANDPVLARQNLLRQPAIATPADIEVYFPGKEAKVRDFDALQGIRDNLSGMRLISDAEAGKGAKLGVFTGHSSAEYRNWVEGRGKSGDLQGKLVVSNSCEGANDPAWNTHVIQEYGATGVLSFPDPITPQAVKDVMVELNVILSEPHTPGESFQRIWRRAVEKAIGEATTEDLRNQLKALLKGILQLSQIQKPGELEASDG